MQRCSCFTQYMTSPDCKIYKHYQIVYVKCLKVYHSVFILHSNTMTWWTVLQQFSSELNKCCWQFADKLCVWQCYNQWIDQGLEMVYEKFCSVEGVFVFLLWLWKRWLWLLDSTYWLNKPSLYSEVSAGFSSDCTYAEFYFCFKA